MQEFWLPAPVFIMGTVATVAGLLAAFFPETLGEKLPETMEDALRIGENSKRGFCTCTTFNIKEQYGEKYKVAQLEHKINDAAITKE